MTVIRRVTAIYRAVIYRFDCTLIAIGLVLDILSMYKVLIYFKVPFCTEALLATVSSAFTLETFLFPPYPSFGGCCSVAAFNKIWVHLSVFAFG